MAEYKVVNITQLEEDLTTVADAIREKSGIADELVFPGGFTSAVTNIQTGGEDYLVARLNGTLSEYSNDKITILSTGAFYYCLNLTSVNLPACTSVGYHAFGYCSRLISVNLPTCSTIANSAFANCTSLTSVSFPVCTQIINSAFQGCSRLNSVYFPICINVFGNAFYNCISLTSVDLPVCRSINKSTFANCRNLTTANFPMVSKITNSAFTNCRQLSKIYLGYSSVCTLSNSNAFTSTPYAGYSSYFSGTPYIYVPASLVDTYKTATNWTYFSSYFSVIEDAPTV